MARHRCLCYAYWAMAQYYCTQYCTLLPPGTWQYYTTYSTVPADKKGSQSAAFVFVIPSLYVHTS